MNFTGKVVLITDAAAGIGAETAIHLSKIGASVALVDRNSESLDDVAEQIIASGSAVAPLKITADVTLDAKRIIDTTVQHFGRLNVLVNCAGIADNGSIANSFSIDSYDRVMNVNVRSILLLSLLAIEHLEKNQRNIVNLSSAAGSVAASKILAYAISKAAVSHFTRCAVLELAKNGIRVNAVSPGAIETTIWHSIGMTNDNKDKCFAQASNLLDPVYFVRV